MTCLAYLLNFSASNVLIFGFFIMIKVVLFTFFHVCQMSFSTDLTKHPLKVKKIEKLESLCHHVSSTNDRRSTSTYQSHLISLLGYRSHLGEWMKPNALMDIVPNLICKGFSHCLMILTNQRSRIFQNRSGKGTGSRWLEEQETIDQ